MRLHDHYMQNKMLMEGPELANAISLRLAGPTVTAGGPPAGHGGKTRKTRIMMPVMTNNKRSNGSNTHRLKSAILTGKFRMSRSEVTSPGPQTIRGPAREPEGLEDGLKTVLKTALA